MFYESNQIKTSKTKWILRGLVLLAFLATALPATPNWVQKQKITSTPRGVGAQFGNAIAINGNTMVVGARFDSTTASQAGAAYVYRLNGGVWTQEAVLLAPGGAALDKFGYSVAISEDTIVVGAYQDDAAFSNSGSAYVFVRSGTTWSFQQLLTPNDAAADDEFGNSVGITGEFIVVGSHLANLTGNSDAGAAYCFRRNSGVWTQTQKLVPISGTGGPILGDNFGESIAVSGSRIAVGATGDDTPQTRAGAVYVFAESSGGLYTLQQKLTISTGTNGDNFGSSVAMEGNTMVAGAREDSPVVNQSAWGSAFVYEFDGASWVSQGQLLASNGAQGDRFGWSVAVSDSVIAVGAREDDTTAGADAGSAYIFTRLGGGWTERQIITPNDSFNGDRFGSGTALSFGHLVVGAAEKALTAPNGQGAAYYFTIPPPKAKFDFDGDGIADISIFRPINGQWWYQQSSNNNVRAATFGTSTDKPAPADYDGDGKTDIAVYRPSTGEWFILRSSNGSFFSVPFGISTDKPAPGDFDGDGLADLTIFRPSKGTWYIQKSSSGVQITQWGAAGDIPVNADYDNDGKFDFAIFRPSDGSWWLNRSTTGITVATFGFVTDKPVPADFTGDGKTDIAVWRPSNGSWYILRSEDNSFYAIPFGTNGDIPAPADYDGDGKADIGIFRPEGANWFIQCSTQGIIIQQFGLASDIPAPSSFVS